MYRHKLSCPLTRFALNACLLTVALLMINNCSSEKPALIPPPDHPIQLRVENDSTTVIDVIQAKPCGANAKAYKPQMTSLMSIAMVRRNSCSLFCASSSRPNLLRQ